MMSFAKLASLLTIDVLLQALSILVAADPTQTETKARTVRSSGVDLLQNGSFKINDTASTHEISTSPTRSFPSTGSIQNISDMIASGFGMKVTSTSKSSPSTLATWPSTSNVFHDSSPSYNLSYPPPSSELDHNDNITSIQEARYHAATNRLVQAKLATNSSSLNSSRPRTSTVYNIFSYNTSTGQILTLTDCLAQWSSFWLNSADTISPVETAISDFAISTVETLDREELLSKMAPTLDQGYPDFHRSTIPNTFTQTLIDNGHPFATITSTTIITMTLAPTASYTELTGTKSVYTTTEVIETYFYLGETFTIHHTTPACVLPSIMPQCQAQWDSWVSIQIATIGGTPSSCVANLTDEGATSMILNDYICAASKSWHDASASLNAAKGSPTPICDLAHIDTAQCNDLRSLHLSKWSDSVTVDHPYTPLMTDIGFQPTEATGSNGSIISSSYWPSTSRLGPGCSLGCGACAITGDTVQLFYWPESKTQEAMNHTKRDYQPITAYALNTTFVSPTVYIYYSKIYEMNSCGRAVGQTYLSRFVAITNTGELSSVWASVNQIALVDDQGYASTDVPSFTAPFNFTDLNTPIPYTIYERQPWCVSWSTSQMRYIDPEGETDYVIVPESPLTCPQTQSYDPILVVPLYSIQAIDPLWSTCSFDLRESFDPPYDLQQVAVAATPTASNMIPAVPATPASFLQMGQPVQTFKGDAAAPASTISIDPQKGSGAHAKDPKSSDPLHHGADSSSGGRSSAYSAINPDSRTSPSIKAGSLHPHLGKSEAVGVTESMLVSSIAGILDPYLEHGNRDSSIITGSKSDIDDVGGAASDAGLRNSHVQDGESFGSQSPESDTAQVQSAIPDTKSNAASSERQAGSGAMEHLVSSSEDPIPNLLTGDPHANSTLAGATVVPFSQDLALDNLELGDPTSSDVDTDNAELKPADSEPSFDSPTLFGRPFSAAIITAQGTTFTAYEVRTLGMVAIPNGLNLDTLSVNRPAATIGKHTISAASDGVIVGSDTYGFRNIIYPFIGLSRQNGVVIPMGSTSMTLQPGSVATLYNGQILSAASNGLILGGAIVPLSDHLDAEFTTELISPFTISGTVYTYFENAAGHHEEVTIPIDDTLVTLLLGGATTTFNGQALSAGAGGFVVGTNTVPYSNALLDTKVLATFTISGTAYTAFQTAGEALIPMGSSYMTLRPGDSPVTFNGKILTAASNGIVIGGSTGTWITETGLDISAFAPGTTTPIVKLAASFTVSGTPYTAVETSIPGRGEMVVISVKSARVTLWPGGPAATVDGEAVGAVTGELVVGGVTETMTTVNNAWVESPLATSTSNVLGIGASGGKSSESLRGGVTDSGSGKLELPRNISCVGKILKLVIGAIYSIALTL